MDRAQNARILDPIFQEAHQVIVTDMVEEPFYVHFDNPCLATIRLAGFRQLGWPLFGQSEGQLLRLLAVTVFV
jgi:hypothetical protein